MDTTVNVDWFSISFDQIVGFIARLAVLLFITRDEKILPEVLKVGLHQCQQPSDARAVCLKAVTGIRCSPSQRERGDCFCPRSQPLLNGLGTQLERQLGPLLVSSWC